MKKTKLIICAAIGITMLFPGGLITKVYAQGKDIVSWFRDFDSKTNNFGVANIDVEIDEDFKPPNDWDGSSNEKLVKVQNNSTGPALIRVSIQKRWVDGNENPWAGDSNFIKLNFSNDENKLWVDGEDGYFYYNKILPKGEVTEAILDSVELKIPEELKERYKGKKVIVDVKTEAVQATIDGYNAVWKNLNNDIKTMLDKLCNKG
ncbi:hypothetical protein BH721_07685 [Clostridium baratii]|uniref:hypothetical protein n=1 Tax=Clostridium baratii TaxID=1561 RepID=UPI0009A302D8|nr:hypothetical protein [Clostridium baratii]OPF50649.1 hypothetical protein A1M12_07375 [Clostridium baratii]OPF54108.1 hypothetical protein BH721_07685 [Clostridium baratii]OPF58672.1 hypothetical protein BH724_00590 [Clostridium baratii]OPF58956.1 hypothetical protein BH725_10050 [Clostridium baratii]